MGPIQGMVWIHIGRGGSWEDSRHVAKDRLMLIGTGLMIQEQSPYINKYKK